jgi:threonine/homoserine/homoserine lactone efflux protein
VFGARPFGGARDLGDGVRGREIHRRRVPGLVRHCGVARRGREPAGGDVVRALVASRRRLVLHAAVTGTLNPKVALFFLAFLPQFVDPARGHVLLQFLVLGLGLATLGFVWDSALAAAAARARGRLLESRRFRAWRDRITGTVLIALGLRLAIAERS